MHVKMKNRKISNHIVSCITKRENGNDERNFAFYNVQFGLNADDIS